MSRAPAPLLFVDVETTGVQPECGHQPWEVAAITEDGRVAAWASWTVDCATADSYALQLGGYGRPTPDGRDTFDRATPAAAALHGIFDGVILAGASVHFDRLMIETWLRRAGHAPAWSHRILDVTTFAAAVASSGGRPMSLRDAGEAVGLTLDQDLAHGALYDAWAAREIYRRARILAICAPDEWDSWDDFADVPVPGIPYVPYEDAVTRTLIVSTGGLTSARNTA